MPRSLVNQVHLSRNYECKKKKDLDHDLGEDASLRPGRAREGATLFLFLFLHICFLFLHLVKDIALDKIIQILLWHLILPRQISCSKHIVFINAFAHLLWPTRSFPSLSLWRPLIITSSLLQYWSLSAAFNTFMLLIKRLYCILVPKKLINEVLGYHAFL